MRHRYLVSILLLILSSYLYTNVALELSSYLYMDGGVDPSNPNPQGGGGSNGPNLPGPGRGPDGGSNHPLVPNSVGRRPDNHSENLFTEHGVTNGYDRNIRDGVIANGYNPNISQQPYASNLMSKVDSLQKGPSAVTGLQIPQELNDRDKEYIDILHRYYRDHVTMQGFNSNRHYPLAAGVKKFIRNLP